MRSRTCFSCAGRLTSKPAVLYGGRMVHNQRESYLLKTCSDCFFEQVVPLIKFSLTDDKFERCAQCHELVDDRVGDYIYLSVYLPKRDLQQFDLRLCDPHADDLWDWFAGYGLVPPNRNSEGSQGPATTQDDVWARAW